MLPGTANWNLGNSTEKYLCVRVRGERITLKDTGKRRKKQMVKEEPELVVVPSNKVVTKNCMAPVPKRRRK